jgi:hypothetical protein
MGNEFNLSEEEFNLSEEELVNFNNSKIMDTITNKIIDINNNINNNINSNINNDINNEIEQNINLLITDINKYINTECNDFMIMQSLSDYIYNNYDLFINFNNGKLKEIFNMDSLFYKKMIYVLNNNDEKRIISISLAFLIVFQLLYSCSNNFNYFEHC